MKATELFVGALVCAESPSGICKVNEILSDHWIDTKGIRHDYERTEPIKLSPQIMQKIGFKEKDCDGEPLWSFEYKRYLITFEAPYGWPCLTIEDVRDKDSNHNVLVAKDEIFNLHELQRAFMVFDIHCDFNIISF